MRIVAVTGMHRSGTAVTARLLNLLGADLGPDDELMPARPANPKGYWENAPLSYHNDEILAALEGSWHEPPILLDDWEEADVLGSIRPRSQELIKRAFDGRDLVCWKDPRLCLLLPYWRKVAPIERTILCIRDPRHVASSLDAREGFPLEKSARLWLRYMTAACRGDPGHHIVSYDSLFDEPRSVLKGLIEVLGVPQPDDGTMAEIDAFIDPSLRHHFEADSPEGPAMNLAVEIFDLIRNAHSERAAPAFEALYQGQIALLKEHETIAALEEKSVEERTRLTAQLNEERSRFGAELDGLSTERDELQVALSEGARRIDDLEGNLRLETDRLEATKSELLASQRRVRAREGRILELKRTLQVAKDSQERLTVKLRENQEAPDRWRRTILYRVRSIFFGPP